MRELSENAVKVLEKRCLMRDIDGNPLETPEGMFRRVAKHIAGAEATEELQTHYEAEFFDLMADLKFLPNSPCLVNAGRERGQLCACFVLPVEDNIEGIFDAIKNTAIIHKTGGGTGFSFSRLRPVDSNVATTYGIASGPLSFMSIFDKATNEMKQGGVRRGANMGVLRVDHPDILEFMDCKKVEGVFDNFNISVGITDEFMETLRSGEDFQLYHEKGPASKNRKVPAKEIWEKIINGAWANGEPGIVFLDAINKHNPLREINNEEIEATNPCGEQPLPPYASCNLGSINLSELVNEDGEFEWDAFKRIVHLAVRFLDNMLTVNVYPLNQIKKYVEKTRRIGLGVMGFADMLIKVCVNYNSEDAVKWADEIGNVLYSTAIAATKDLFQEKGSGGSKVLDKMKQRNGAVTTIAPTGSLSLIANCSSGIEPNFDVEYEKFAVDTKLEVIPPLFRPYVERKAVPPSYFVTTKDISIEQHIRIQAAFQPHIDSGISKTVNAPNETTVEEVDRAFRFAYTSGCKGITFYRSGSRKFEALSKKKATFGRPNRLYGFTEKITTGLGKIYITLNKDGDRPREMFIGIGKAGNDVLAMCEAVGRLLSLIFKKDIADVDEVVKQLKGIGGESTAWYQGQAIKSIPDAIGKFLEGEFLAEKKVEVDATGLLCPDCQGRVVIHEGCPSCVSCGWKSCSEQ